MSNVWYFLVGFLLGDSSSSPSKSKAPKNRGLELPQNAIRILIMILSALAVLALVTSIIPNMVEYYQ